MINKYPYTNFHELNQDWIIDEIKNVKDKTDEIDEAVNNANASAESASASAESASASAESASASAESASASAESATETVADTLNQINVLQARVDNIIPEGTQTEGNTELLDIRVGVNGEIYPSAGDAVRGQITDLNNRLYNITGAVNAELYSKSADSPSRFGNTVSWRWFYPVTVQEGDTLVSVVFYSKPLNTDSTTKIEVWEDNGQQLTLLTYQELTITANSGNAYKTVNFNVRANNPLRISITSSGGLNIGAYVSQGTELAYHYNDKTVTVIDPSALIQYFNASIVGTINIIEVNAPETNEYTQEVINVSGTENNFLEAVNLANASNADDVIIHVKPGTYDLISEYGSSYLDSNDIVGPSINRDITIIFDAGSKITAHYTGTNEYIKQHFSIINTARYNLKLVNATLDASNIRYCVHDDHGANTTPYASEYINCKMKIDNVNNTAFTYANCIGAGLGVHGYINIDGGYYEGYRANDDTVINDNVDIRIHNSSASDAQSRIIINNIYCRKGVGSMSYGTSTLLTDYLVSNCSFKRDVYEGYSTGGTVQNMNVIKWNNTIRG